MRTKKAKSTVMLVVVLLYCLLSVMGLSACKTGESTTINISMYNTTASTSLFFTGIVKEYYSGLDTYAYFSEDLSNTIDKLNKEKLQSACVIAYVTVNQLEEIFNPRNKQSKIILIDNYNTEGAIEGVWIARTDWIEASPTSYKKMVKALLRSMNYRAENIKMSYEEAQSSISKGYNLKKNTDVMQFVAIYEADNNCAIKDIYFDYTDANSFIDSLEDYNEGMGESYEKCKEAYITAFGSEPTEEDMDRVFDFSAASNMDFDTVITESSTDNGALKFILFALFGIAGFFAVVVIVNTLKGFVKEIKSQKQLKNCTAEEQEEGDKID